MTTLHVIISGTNRGLGCHTLPAVNKSISQQALQVSSGSRRIEDNLAGSLQSKFAAASGESRNKIRRGHYNNIAICTGELENCHSLLREVESLEVHVIDIGVDMQSKEQEVIDIGVEMQSKEQEVIDIGVEMQSKEQEVTVLQQATEQLMTEREAENRELMTNSAWEEYRGSV